MHPCDENGLENTQKEEQGAADRDSSLFFLIRMFYGTMISLLHDVI